MKKILAALAFSAEIALAAPRLEPFQAKARQLLWTDGVMQLSRASLTKDQPSLGYAVLQARPTAALKSMLPKDYSTMPTPRTLDRDYFVVPIDELKTLERLAQWAHESSGACGSIEFVALNSSVATTTTSYPPIYGGRIAFDTAKTLIDQVSLTTIDQTIDTLTALASRYYNHPVGVNAHSTVRQIWESLMVSARWTITEETQPYSNQKSIVARLEGTSRPEETIVLGAHLDSTVSRSGNSAVDNAPGADDDASGVGVLSETLRIIEANQLSFDRSIELQAYAAEEIGLIGSKAIAAKYAAAGKKIAGMMQIDMAYYSLPAASGIIHLLQDYNSRDLRRSTIDLIRGYLGQVYTLGVLPRGSSSDHKSFYDQGYPTVFPFEDPEHDNPHIHTADDTRAQFDDGKLIKRIAQLALLFAIHQGGLTALANAYANLSSGQLPADLRQNVPVAIQTAEGGYRLAVSAPLTAQTVEFCLIDNGSDLHCVKEREVLDKSDSGSARKFFFSMTVFSLAAGQKWRVLVYDKDDELIAWRQFSLAAP